MTRLDYKKISTQTNRWYRVLKIRFRQSASSKWGIWILFLFAFADASFLPLPVTTYFLILILLNKSKSNSYVIYVLLGTLTGAISGYSFGRLALLNIEGDFTGLGQFLFDNIPGFSLSIYNKMQMLFSKWDFWILCVAAVTPIPYAVFSVCSGAFKINFIVFLFATIISQGVKFFLMAYSTLNLGIQINRLGKVNWKPAAIVTSAIIGVIIFISNIIKNLFQIN
jgi:membrane protein YqaA with SNARE-associated domain